MPKEGHNKFPQTKGVIYKKSCKQNTFFPVHRKETICSVQREQLTSLCREETCCSLLTGKKHFIHCAKRRKPSVLFIGKESLKRNTENKYFVLCAQTRNALISMHRQETICSMCTEKKTRVKESIGSNLCTEKSYPLRCTN